MKHKMHLWLFNPHCELSILKEQRHFTPSKVFKSIQKDLSPLLLWLCKEDEAVLIHQKIKGKKWLEVISLITQQEITILTFEEIRKRKYKFDLLKTWGRSPSLISDIQPIQSNIKNIPEWKASYKFIFHRKKGYGLLKEMVLKDEISFTPSPNEIGAFYSSLESATTAIEKIFLKNPFGVILKLPYSSSGRGILVMKREEMTPSITRWIESGIEQQGSVLLEPLLQKVQDFSLLFYKEEDKVDYLGGTSFLSGPTGQYYGSKLNAFHHLFTDLERRELDICIDMIQNFIEKEEAYTGYVGVDAMIYQDQLGEKKIHPCIEINPRLTMGHITLMLEGIIADRKEAVWRITTKHEEKDFQLLEEKLQKEYPLSIINGKVERGFLPLVDVNSVENYYAYLLVKNEKI